MDIIDEAMGDASSSSSSSTLHQSSSPRIMSGPELISLSVSQIQRIPSSLFVSPLKNQEVLSLRPEQIRAFPRHIIPSSIGRTLYDRFSAQQKSAWQFLGVPIEEVAPPMRRTRSQEKKK
jgi:hypothetical protein